MGCLSAVELIAIEYDASTGAVSVEQVKIFKLFCPVDFVDFKAVDIARNVQIDHSTLLALSMLTTIAEESIPAWDEANAQAP